MENNELKMELCRKRNNKLLWGLLNVFVIPSVISGVWVSVFLIDVASGNYGMLTTAAIIPVINFLILTCGIVQLYSWGKEINNAI